MKTNVHNHLRRAVAILALAGIFAVSAHASVYQMKSNYLAGTAAPYNAGGGVPAQPFITSQTITPTNATLCSYGMMGWYSVQSSPDLITWTQVGNTVAATDFGWTFTVTNALGLSGNFRLAMANSYAGQSACSGCHGDKYTAYLTTKHSAAYSSASASTNFALVCRTVGYGQPFGFVDAATTPNLENVGCENCHGPAGWHKNSDHDLIRPAVSLDPAICGSCHQGSLHPIYQEYTNYTTELCDGNATFSHSRTARSSGFGCAACHSAENREVMLEENEDMLAGNSHPLTLITGSDASLWTATCATCHEPHSSNYVAQLRYPTYSTNFFTMPTVTDVRNVVTTNYGSVTTNSVSYNTVFDSLYNPNIQVCAQCHNGRGTRWDGTAYGLVTNNVVSGPVTNTVFVNTYCTNTVTQVFTNSLGNPYLTNTYTYSYVCGRYATNVVTLSQTNQVIAVGVYAPLIAYTNGGTVFYSTNSSGFSSPHLNDQYNILVGILNPDYLNTNALGVATNMMHSHSKAPDQCATCHVPEYSVNSQTNVTGHSFVHDYNGCLTSCHSSYTADALTAKIRNLQFIETNNITRVVSMLNQWALTETKGTLLTNYGPLAWEFSSIGSLSKKATNNGVIYGSGPPKAYNPALGLVPAGTNDNLQLLIPDDIRRARFNLYEVFADQSLGVHNPTYVQYLLDDAATRVTRQFTAANFSANTIAGFAPLTVKFSNTGSGITGYNWSFGDGNNASVANPTNVYYNPGIYSVTFTASTAAGSETLMKTNYIRVLTPPVLSFVADQTSVTAGTMVNFSNTSTGTANVFRWTWSPMLGVSGAPSYDTAGSATSFSFTYTNAGTYSVQLRATCPGGANGNYNRVTVTNTAYIIVH